MKAARPGTIGVACLLAASSLAAADFASYREFRFGASPAAIGKLPGISPAEAKVIHQVPARIEQLDWQPHAFGVADKPDPVRDAQLFFYNGELYRMVVTYDRYKVTGLTVDDMIDGVSATYGAASRPKAEISYHSFFGDVAPVAARWEDPLYSYNLVQTGDGSSYALVLYSKRLEPLAQAAIVEATRLETQDAPRQEAARHKKQDDEDRIVLEKARLVNKSQFRP